MDLGIKLHVSEGGDPLSNLSACKRIIRHIIHLSILRADSIQLIIKLSQYMVTQMFYLQEVQHQLHNLK